MKKTFALSRHQARELDRLTIEKYHIPGIVLMENAGRGIVDCFLTHKPQGKTIICCGRGNNAGDGFVVARYLYNLHMPVHVLLFGQPDEISGDAKINYDIVDALGLPTTVMLEDNLQTLEHVLSDADWIIDALFGTGLQGKVKAPFVRIIDAINSAHKKVLSIDIPSGLDCDTGDVLGVAIRATQTVTMAGVKQGFLNPMAQDYLGNIDIVDIGTPRDLLDAHMQNQTAVAYQTLDLLDRVVFLEQDAAAFGFRWETSAQIMAQIESECVEISEHLAEGTQANQYALEEEIGDLLHAVFSLCVFCHFNPAETLKHTLDKFERRLNAVKKIAHERGLTDLNGHAFNELMCIWELAKQKVG